MLEHDYWYFNTFKTFLAQSKIDGTKHLAIVSNWPLLYEKLSLLGKKLKFVATIGIFYILKIQKRIVSAETIRGNTIIKSLAMMKL